MNFLYGYIRIIPLPLCVLLKHDEELLVSAWPIYDNYMADKIKFLQSFAIYVVQRPNVYTAQIGDNRSGG